MKNNEVIPGHNTQNKCFPFVLFRKACRNYRKNIGVCSFLFHFHDIKRIQTISIREAIYCETLFNRKIFDNVICSKRCRNKCASNPVRVFVTPLESAVVTCAKVKQSEINRLNNMITTKDGRAKIMKTAQMEFSPHNIQTIEKLIVTENEVIMYYRQRITQVKKMLAYYSRKAWHYYQYYCVQLKKSELAYKRGWVELANNYFSEADYALRIQEEYSFLYGQVLEYSVEINTLLKKSRQQYACNYVRFQ